MIGSSSRLRLRDRSPLIIVHESPRSSLRYTRWLAQYNRRGECGLMMYGASQLTRSPGLAFSCISSPPPPPPPAAPAPAPAAPAPAAPTPPVPPAAPAPAPPRPAGALPCACDWRG